MEPIRISKKTRKTGNVPYGWPENQHPLGLSTCLGLIQGQAKSLFKNLKAEHSTSTVVIVTKKLPKFEAFLNLHNINMNGQLTI